MSSSPPTPPRRLELWSGETLGRSHPVSLGRQPLGHKQQEGDGRTHRFVDWTDGCIALTNAEMAQVWDAVARRHADRDPGVGAPSQEPTIEPLDAEFEIRSSGSPTPIRKPFGKRLNGYELESVPASHVAG